MGQAGAFRRRREAFERGIDGGRVAIWEGSVAVGLDRPGFSPPPTSSEHKWPPVVRLEGWESTVPAARGTGGVEAWQGVGQVNAPSAPSKHHPRRVGSGCPGHETSVETTGSRTATNERPRVSKSKREGPMSSKLPLTNCPGLGRNQTGWACGAGGGFANGARGQLVVHASI